MTGKQLPKGWAQAPLGDVLDINPRDDLSSLPGDTLVSFLPMQAVEELSGRIDSSRERPIEEVRRGYTQFRDGDLLVAKITPCMENGKFAIAENLKNRRGFGSTEFHVLRCPPEILNRYVFYYLIRDAFRNEAAHNMKGTAGQKRVPADWVARADIRIAPFAEQGRIVAAVDALFSRLDIAEAGLKRADDLRLIYVRAAKDALVTGCLHLTSGGTEYPASGREWLMEILARRKRLWCARVGGMSDRPSHLLNAAKRYAEPISADGGTNAPCSLPVGWTWAPLGHLLLDIEAGKNLRCIERPPSDHETGIVKVSAVSWGRFLEEESKTLPIGSAFDPKHRIHKGDFLFSRANTVELVGACVIADEISRNLLLSDKILRFEFAVNIEPWVLLVLRSPLGRRQIEALSTGNQESMRNISQESIRKILIPLPPKELLKHLVSVGEALLESADALGRTLKSNLDAVSKTRQAVLAAAFRGELVARDPNDEPAEEFLERIRTSRVGDDVERKRFGRKVKVDA